MKKMKLCTIMALLLIAVLTASACSKSYNMKEDTSSSKNHFTEYDMGEEAKATSDSLMYGNGEMASTIVDTTAATDSGMTENEELASSVADAPLATDVLDTGAGQKVSTDKIIRYFYLDLETQKFDQLISNINTRISSLGGYIESSQIGGNSYYNMDGNRSGSIIARIPNDKTDEFVNGIDEEANVISSRQESENVSLQYIDIQSRVEALEIEQERLFEILGKSDNLENIITLESRLSDIRYELQSYQSQLRSFDNKVDYSTISLSIQEVNRISPVTVAKPTFGSRVKNGFGDTIYNISEGILDFLVWFIVNLPYLLIWGIIIALIIIIIRRWIRKSKAKLQTRRANAPINSINNYPNQNQNNSQNPPYQPMPNQGNDQYKQ